MLCAILSMNTLPLPKTSNSLDLSLVVFLQTSTLTLNTVGLFQKQLKLTHLSLQSLNTQSKLSKTMNFSNKHAKESRTTKMLDLVALLGWLTVMQHR